MLFSLLNVFVIYYLYYQEWQAFVQASLGSVSHDLKLLIYRYIRDGFKILIFSSFIVANFFLYAKVSKLYSNDSAFRINIAIYLFFVPVFLFAGYSYPLFLAALAFSVAVLHFFTTSGKTKKMEYIILFVFVAFLFINPAGSNLGFLKASFLFLLFPFVLSNVKLKAKNFWISIIVVLIPFAFFGKFFRTYEDGEITTLKKTLDFEVLYPIQTSEERYKFLKTIDQQVTELQEQDVQVYFYGNKSHIFHYLYPDSSLDIKAFNQPVDDLIFYPIIKDEISDKAKVAIFLVTSYPESTETSENILKKELLSRGFTKSGRGALTYLLKVKSCDND
ncbi:hypothetical protein [Salinimicrobium sp. TH3]|uniref:hypothetical protein n=1 Tax=Salinimicrobium sp. TH3 TaxID=2997342 RepID=UPI002272B318|nr:hypothetical protein [Salinimicrobium sp. TH3]MCY2686940.1 hypothetical protein [Salinimicrobium sp. TH3]